MIIFLYVLMLTVSVSLYLVLSHEYDEAILKFVIICMGVSLLLFQFRKEQNTNIKNNYFRPGVLFLFGYTIVHFQYYIDLLLSNVSPTDSFLFVNQTIICKAALLSLIGLISFLLGYTIYKSRDKLRRYSGNISLVPILPLVFLSYLLIFLFIYNTDISYFSGGYGVEKDGTISGYIELFCQLIFYAILIINSRNCQLSANRSSFLKYIKSFGYLFYIPFSFYCGLVLMSGDRGPVISLLIGYLFSYIIATGHKIKSLFFIFIILSGAIFVTILGIARSVDNRDLSFIEKINDAVDSGSRMSNYKSFSPYTAELAGSVRTLHRAMAYVPEIQSYFNGLFQTKYILASVPFSSSLTSKLFDPQYKYRSSASFITWIRQGDNPTSGDGVTCVADLYLDFGLIGVLAGLFLFGLFTRKIEVLITSGANISLWIYVVGFYLMIMSLYVSRSSIMFHIRGIVWLYAIIFIYEYLTRRYAKR